MLSFFDIVTFLGFLCACSRPSGSTHHLAASIVCDTVVDRIASHAVDRQRVASAARTRTYTGSVVQANLRAVSVVRSAVVDTIAHGASVCISKVARA